MNRHQEDDWRLLAEPAGLEALFERHKDYVFRTAWGLLGNRALADDVTQEVFLRLAQGRRRWRPRAAFRTLLYRITINTARETERKRRREGQLPESFDLPGQAAAMPGILRSDLARAMGTLPRRQREVVLLRYFEELSTRETAHVLRCREGTVKTHLHRAMAALRQAFVDLGTENTSATCSHA